MAKAAGPPKKQTSKPKLSDKEQSERFIEAARELGLDETGKKFDEAFERIARNSGSSVPRRKDR